MDTIYLEKKNIDGKREIARYEQFLVFSQCPIYLLKKITLRAISPFLSMFCTLYGTYFPFFNGSNFGYLV